MKTCPNCGLQSEPTDTKCPKCGIVFEKWEAIEARKKAEKEKIDAEEKSKIVSKFHKLETTGKKANKNNEARGNKAAKKRHRIKSSSARLWIFVSGFIFLAVFAFWYYQKEKVDFAKFENAYRCINSIRGATSIGVNYSQFTELLQELNTELLILINLKRSPREQEILQTYTDVFNIYKDSHELWEAKTSSKKDIFDLEHLDNTIALNIPVDGFRVYGSARAIVDKYNIETWSHNIELLSTTDASKRERTWTLAPNASIQILWGLAEKEFKSCNYPKK